MTLHSPSLVDLPPGLVSFCNAFALASVAAEARLIVSHTSALALYGAETPVYFEICADPSPRGREAVRRVLADLEQSKDIGYFDSTMPDQTLVVLDLESPTVMVTFGGSLGEFDLLYRGSSAISGLPAYTLLRCMSNKQLVSWIATELLNSWSDPPREVALDNLRITYVDALLQLSGSGLS